MKGSNSGVASSPADAMEPVFHNLVVSAFDFLERAIDGVERDRKHSIIHFATAIELFLKARLIKEHWSLVADNPDQTDRHSFLTGTSKTVTPERAISRLERICGAAIPKEAADEFKRISLHRNKAIHFFHEVSAEDAGEEALRQTAIEQFRGWNHLNGLLDAWSEHFEPYSASTARVNLKMKRYDQYLAVRYQAIRPEIERQKSEGAAYVACRSCSYEAARRTELTDAISELECRVCGVNDAEISFECTDPDCGHEVRLSPSRPGHRSCLHCKTFYDNSDVQELLESDPRHWPDDTGINCAGCLTPGSGFEHRDMVVCNECLTVEKDAPTCGWCAERQMGGGDLRHSQWTGCEFCEGRAGWDRD